MKKSILTVIMVFVVGLTINAQNDTMYVMKNGVAVGKYNVNTQVDSVIFYKPTTSTSSINLTFVNIPGGTFIMGSPITEPNRDTDETQFQVTLSAFRMSKYEITNAQYAAFLNAKNIGYDGKYITGAYPEQAGPAREEPRPVEPRS